MDCQGTPYKDNKNQTNHPPTKQFYPFVCPLSVSLRVSFMYCFSKGTYLHALRGIMDVTKGWPLLCSCLSVSYWGSRIRFIVATGPWKSGRISCTPWVLSCCREHRQAPSISLSITGGEPYGNIMTSGGKDVLSEAARPGSPQNWNIAHRPSGYSCRSRMVILVSQYNAGSSLGRKLLLLSL